MKPLIEYIATIARREVGVSESPRGSNRGPRVDQYQAATWLNKKDWGAWCASFVCWVVREAMKEAVKNGAKFTFQRPRTAGAFDFENWSLKQDESTRTRRSPGRDLKPWDIVIYGFSHIGFVSTVPDSKGRFLAIEGNTNDEGGREGYEVAERSRHIRDVIVRIRFTV